MNPLIDTFDDFVVDLLDSDIDLLTGELDYLIMQHLLNSIELSVIKNNEFSDNNTIAA